MVQGGHAANALPQSVTANVNCRIFPGTTRAQARDIIKGVIGDERISVELTDDGSLGSPESPLRDDVIAAMTKAVHERVPGPRGGPVDERGGERFDVFPRARHSGLRGRGDLHARRTTISRTGSTSACRWRRSIRA